MAGLLGWAWMGERVAGRTWGAMGAALLGSAIMVSRYFYTEAAAGSLGGDLLAFTVALAFAAATVIVRSHPTVSMPAAVALAAALGALFASAWAEPLSVRPRDLGLLAFFGIGQLGAGLLLFTAGARLIPVAEASLIAVLESVLGPVWVWLAVGERPGAFSLVGGGMILSALIVHTAADLVRPLRAYS